MKLILNAIMPVSTKVKILEYTCNNPDDANYQYYINLEYPGNETRESFVFGVDQRFTSDQIESLYNNGYFDSFIGYLIREYTKEA